MSDPTLGLPPIHEDYRTNEKRQEMVVGRLTQQFTHYAQQRANHVEKLWELAEQIYLGEDNSSINPYSAQYEIKEVFRQLESEKALAIGQLFGNELWFEYKPRVAGQEEQANIATQMVHYQLKSMGGDEALFKWVQECFKWGTTYLQYGWSQFRRQRKKITKIVLDDGRPAWKRDDEEVVHGGPYLEWLNPWKVYHHPDVDKISDSPWVFVREMVSGEYLKTQTREGFFDEEKVKKALAEGAAISGDFLTSSADRHIWDANDEELLGDKEFELTTAWSNGGWVYSLINGRHLAQAQRQNYSMIPMFNLRNYPQADLGYGISEAVLLAAEQMLLRDICSMWVDTVHYRLNPMFVVKEYLRNQWEQVRFVPGETLYAERPNEDIQKLDVSAETFQLQQAAEYVRRGMTLATGMTDEVTGLGSSHRTASGLMRLQDAASARGALRIAQWEPTFREVYGGLYTVNSLFLDEEIALRVYGVDGSQVFNRFGPENFSGDIDVEVNLPRTMQPPAERQRTMLLFYQQALQRPDLWNLGLLQEELARAFQFRFPRRLITSPARSQEDALWENQDFMATGFIADPAANDNHQGHLQIHGMLSLAPEFAQRSPVEITSFKRHLARHQAFLQMQMAQGGGMAPAAGMPALTGDGASMAQRMESSGIAEGSTGPGQMGGEVQGELTGEGALSQ